MTATLVDRDAAIEALSRVDGWLYLATQALAAPAHAALYIEGVEPMECVQKLHAAVQAVESCRESVCGLRRAFQRVRPHP